MASSEGNNTDDSTDSGQDSDQPSAKSIKMDESTENSNNGSKEQTPKTTTTTEQKTEDEGSSSNVHETNNETEPVAMVTQEGDASASDSTASTTDTGVPVTASCEPAAVEASKDSTPSSDDTGAITTSETSQTTPPSSVPKETVNMKVMYNKKKYDVTFDLDGDVTGLKAHIQTITGVPPAMQKLMFKGLMKDDKTLRELKVSNGAKLMLVGSTITDVLEVTKPVTKGAAEKEAEAAAAAKESLCKQKIHKKVLDKGKPEDAMPGIKKRKDPLPTVPISGMYNKNGGKVRLTFKLELDQLWIGTKERTEKVPMTSIKNVISEPIDGHEEYHILAIQLGPTEASRYWLYWVPAQYTMAIKDAILGKWQYF